MRHIPKDDPPEDATNLVVGVGCFFAAVQIAWMVAYALGGWNG